MFCINYLFISVDFKNDMKIFVIVGMPASGKNIARSFAESKKIPYFATGDIVRDEVKKTRSRSKSRQHSGSIDRFKRE